MAQTLEEVQRRIEVGIGWLTEHDPTGRFHLWYESRILPSTPMPAQDAKSRAAYREYYNGRETFERLWKQMERMERSP